MMKLATILSALHQIAPLEYAESWDNVGLLVGSSEKNVSVVMTCLTLTPTTLAEAIERKAQLVAKKKEQMVRYQWLDESDKETNFFELRIKIDEMTGELALIVTDFADEGEEADQKMLWDEAVHELKRHIGG